MTVQRSAISGIAFPGDMDALHRIYDSLCNERGFCHGSPAAQDLARATMSLFSQGVSDESEIRESIAIYLGRMSPAATLLYGGQ